MKDETFAYGENFRGYATLRRMRACRRGAGQGKNAKERENENRK
jgi:hypothetical protein